MADRPEDQPGDDERHEDVATRKCVARDCDILVGHDTRPWNAEQALQRREQRPRAERPGEEYESLAPAPTVDQADSSRHHGSSQSRPRQVADRFSRAPEFRPRARSKRRVSDDHVNVGQELVFLVVEHRLGCRKEDAERDGGKEERSWAGLSPESPHVVRQAGSAIKVNPDAGERKGDENAEARGICQVVPGRQNVDTHDRVPPLPVLWQA